MPRQKLQQWREPIPEKRRSEVDRRLDFLINTKGSGALKDVQQNTVLRLLRLFNLCDLGTNSADKDKTKHAFGLPRRVARPRHVQNAVDHCEVPRFSIWILSMLTLCWHGGCCIFRQSADFLLTNSLHWYWMCLSSIFI